LQLGGARVVRKVRAVHESHVVLATRSDDAIDRGQAGERLLAQHVLAAPGSRNANLFAYAGRRGHVDRIDLVRSHQFGPRIEGVGHFMFIGVGLRRFHAPARDRN